MFLIISFAVEISFDVVYWAFVLAFVTCAHLTHALVIVSLKHGRI